MPGNCFTESKQDKSKQIHFGIFKKSNSKTLILTTKLNRGFGINFQYLCFTIMFYIFKSLRIIYKKKIIAKTIEKNINDINQND